MDIQDYSHSLSMDNRKLEKEIDKLFMEISSDDSQDEESHSFLMEFNSQRYFTAISIA